MYIIVIDISFRFLVLRIEVFRCKDVRFCDLQVNEGQLRQDRKETSHRKRLLALQHEPLDKYQHDNHSAHKSLGCIETSQGRSKFHHHDNTHRSHTGRYGWSYESRYSSLASHILETPGYAEILDSRYQWQLIRDVVIFVFVMYQEHKTSTEKLYHEPFTFQI